jgi:hypothetical protein
MAKQREDYTVKAQQYRFYKVRLIKKGGIAFWIDASSNSSKAIWRLGRRIKRHFSN